MRKFTASAVVVLFAFTLATAEDLGGRITKIDGNKITYLKAAKKKMKAEEATIDMASEVKYSTGTRVFDKETKKATYTADKDVKTTADSVKEAVTKAGEKGLNVRLITADDGDNKGKVVEIQVLQAKKKVN